jgi:hypothetical protein
VSIKLHLTDDTQLRAHGFVAGSGLFAEVHWDHGGPFPDAPGDGVLCGTPVAMRKLAELAIQAAIQAEEEACWQAYQAAAAAEREPAA